MSFEGYYQVLCKKGHLSVFDAYNAPTEEEFECKYCGEKTAWWNLVDVTNGSWDEAGNRIDGFVDLQPEIMEFCETCKRVMKPIVYKIPIQNKGEGE